MFQRGSCHVRISNCLHSNLTFWDWGFFWRQNEPSTKINLGYLIEINQVRMINSWCCGNEFGVALTYCKFWACLVSKLMQLYMHSRHIEMSPSKQWNALNETTLWLRIEWWDLWQQRTSSDLMDCPAKGRDLSFVRPVQPYGYINDDDLASGMIWYTELCMLNFDCHSNLHRPLAFQILAASCGNLFMGLWPLNPFMFGIGIYLLKIKGYAFILSNSIHNTSSD